MYTFSSKTHSNAFILPCLHFLNYLSPSQLFYKGKNLPSFRACSQSARAYLRVVQVYQSLGHHLCPSTSRALVAYRLVTSFSTSFSAVDNDNDNDTRAYVYGRDIRKIVVMPLLVVHEKYRRVGRCKGIKDGIFRQTHHQPINWKQIR